MNTIQQISPETLKQKMADAGDDLILLDVREPHEREICQLPNSLAIPMPMIPLYMDKLDHDKEIVVYCHHGVRSYHVINYLIEAGFEPENLLNLEGGIDAWAMRVEPEMRRY